MHKQYQIKYKYIIYLYQRWLSQPFNALCAKTIRHTLKILQHWSVNPSGANHTKTIRRQTASDVVLEFLLLTLNIFHTFLYSFYCYFEQVNVSWEYHSRYLLAKHQQWKHQNDVWSEVCLKLAIKTPERTTDFTNHSDISIVHSELIVPSWHLPAQIWQKKH